MLHEFTGGTLAALVAMAGIAPLIAREQVVGVLNLFYKTGINAFDEEALRLAQVYADQAAVFIENARLMNELRQAAVQLETRAEQRTQELKTTQAQVIRAEKDAIAHIRPALETLASAGEMGGGSLTTTLIIDGILGYRL